STYCAVCCLVVVMTVAGTPGRGQLGDPISLLAPTIFCSSQLLGVGDCDFFWTFFAGETESKDGVGSHARFDSPVSVAVDGHTDLIYVSERRHIRRVTVVRGMSGRGHGHGYSDVYRVDTLCGGRPPSNMLSGPRGMPSIEYMADLIVDHRR